MTYVQYKVCFVVNNFFLMYNLIFKTLGIKTIFTKNNC